MDIFVIFWWNYYLKFQKKTRGDATKIKVRDKNKKEFKKEKRVGKAVYNLLTDNSTSEALTVFRPACFASFTASPAITSPCSSNALARASLASSLTLSAPAFFIILPIGAIGNSAIISPHFCIFVIILCCPTLIYIYRIFQ
jgi:hypothetical protein